LAEKSFFSFQLFDENTKQNVGRLDLKVNNDLVLLHIGLQRLPRIKTYDLRFFFEGGNTYSDEIKLYVTTSPNGSLNNTLRLSPKNLKVPAETFKKVMGAIFLPRSGGENIVGFCGKPFDYKADTNFQEIPASQDLEYCKNSKLDEILNNEPVYWPFLNEINSMTSVKINKEIFENLNLNVRENLKKFMANTLKIYGFLLLLRLKNNGHFVYMIGIPDKYSCHQVLAMVNMGAGRFRPMDFSARPSDGDLGFWVTIL
jgi:hypothetical protein